jgi:hypothetical protein
LSSDVNPEEDYIFFSIAALALYSPEGFEFLKKKGLY